MTPTHLWGRKHSNTVLPTFHDPWGLVVNEAMSFGLPVIVTDAAGCTDLEEDNGLVVRAGDVDALGGALASS